MLVTRRSNSSDTTLRGSSRWRIRAATAALVALLALTAAACGDDDEGNDQASAGNGGESSLLPPMPEATDGADVEEARSVVEESLEPMQFEEPGPAFDAGEIADPIWLVTCSQGNRYCKRVTDAFREAGAAAGVEVKTFVAGSDPAQNAAGINTAVSQGAAAIVLFSIDPATVRGPLEAAQEAGVGVVSLNNTDPDEPPLPGTDANSTVDFTYSGKVNAAYAVAKFGSEANAFCAAAPAFKVTILACDGFESELARLCPDCEYERGNFDVLDVTTGVPAGIQAAIRSEPGLNFVMCGYDNLCESAVPAIRQAGGTDTVIAGSQTGQIVPNLEWVRDGEIQYVDVGNPNAWTAWAALDQAMRLAAGLDPAERGGNVPLKVFTHESLSQRPDVPLNYDGDNEELVYETDGGALYQDGYKQLWGVE